MTEEEFIRDNPQYSHLKDDDLWDAMTEAMLASGMEFELPKQEGPTESYSMVIWDVSEEVEKIKNLQDYCKDEMFKAVGVPSKYIGGFDPYNEDSESVAVVYKINKGCLEVVMNSIRDKKWLTKK